MIKTFEHFNLFCSHRHGQEVPIHSRRTTKHCKSSKVPRCHKLYLKLELVNLTVKSQVGVGKVGRGRGMYVCGTHQFCGG